MEYQYHIFSPYRVCPIGAHVDHQHGLVTGFAIDKGVDFWFSPNDDGHVHLESLTFDGTVDFDLTQATQVRERHWGDYARGVKYALKKRFTLRRGVTGVVQGSLPVGGLSSSAAVLIAYTMAFANANDIELTPFEVVTIASEAEREYIGLNNGILDQACIALGRKDGLLFLDCDSNEYRIIRRNPAMADFEIGIFFSGLTRSLVNSDYNLRVYECKTAAWDMLAYTDQPLKPFDKTFLRDIPKSTFEKTRIAMPRRFALGERQPEAVRAPQLRQLREQHPQLRVRLAGAYRHIRDNAYAAGRLRRSFLRRGLQGRLHGVGRPRSQGRYRA